MFYVYIYLIIYLFIYSIVISSSIIKHMHTQPERKSATETRGRQVGRLAEYGWKPHRVVAGSKKPITGLIELVQV